MTMPKLLNAWPLLSLLVLIQSRTTAGQAFFMDGAPGCSSNGYGISIQELNIECEADNEDGACYFDELVTISGTVTTLGRLPTNVKVIPRLCHRSGYNCSAPLIEYTYVSFCDYLEEQNGVACPYAGTSSFSAEMYLPNNAFIQDLYEWGQEINENLYENEEEWYGYDIRESEFECDEEDDRYDCEELKEEYEQKKEEEEETYAYGTIGTVNPKFQLKVTFEPVQDLNIFASMYAGERWTNYGYNKEGGEQDQEAQQAENSYYYYRNKRAYTEEQAEGKKNWQKMVNAYMAEPTHSIYCHIPFRMVADEYNVTAYKERNYYYKSWWYRFFNGMLSDCELTFSCQDEENGQQREGNTYYYAGSVGVVSLLGSVYRIAKRRRTVTEGDEALVKEEDEKIVEFSKRSIRPEQIEGDSYVTMS